MHWDEVSYYKGEWFEGAQHGEGEVYENGKMIEKGYYENGRLKIEAPKEETHRKQIPIPKQFATTKKTTTKSGGRALPSVVERQKGSSFSHTSYQTGKFKRQRSPRTTAMSPIDHRDKIAEQKL